MIVSEENKIVTQEYVYPSLSENGDIIPEIKEQYYIETKTKKVEELKVGDVIKGGKIINIGEPEKIINEYSIYNLVDVNNSINNSQQQPL